MRKTIAMASLFAILVMALGLSVQAGDGKVNPRVLPDKSVPYGKTYADWGAAWWQWELLATTVANPVLDTTGEFAHLNQSGPVFFLAGTFGGEAVRDVTVPPGKAFFLPITNWVLTAPEDSWALDWYNAENPDKPPLTELTAEAMKAILDWWISSQTGRCEVDGVAVQGFRAQSEAFDLFLPEDCMSVTDWGYAPGWHYPNVSDGIWVMLAPLPAGQHVIHIQVPGYLDVVYNLTVQAQ